MDDTIDIDLQYWSGPRLLKITATDGEFPNNSAFVLVLTTGIEDLSGAPLDGNANGVEDSAQYDLLRSTFYTGTGANELPDYISPMIAAFYPSTDTTLAHMDSSQFAIVLSFTGNDVDTTTLTDNIITLYHLNSVNGTATDTTVVVNALTVYDRTLQGVAYCLQSAEDTTKFVRGNRYLLRFNTSAVSDTSGNPLLWGDEVNDGSIPDFYFGFVMEPAAGQDIIPPKVSSINTGQYNNSWRVIVYFNENMDTTTFNEDNIAFFNESLQRLDGDFLKWPDDLSSFTFYPRQGTQMPVYYYFTTAVTDSAGNHLDGNNNGRGGEPDDIYSNLP
jgi:hypothetical protein